MHACQALLDDARAAGLDRPRSDVMRALALCRIEDGAAAAIEAEFALG
jgi:hypothetical protein